MNLYQDRKSMSWYLFAAVLMVTFHVKVQTKTSKYSVDVESAKQCPEPEYANAESPIRNVKVNKLNRTVRAFNMDISIKRPLDEDVAVKMDLEIWAYAGWTPVPYIPLQPDFCNRFRKVFNDSMMYFLHCLGVERPEECPIPPGNYSMKNCIFDNESLSKLLPFEGRFKTRTVLKSMRTKRVILCLEIMIKSEKMLGE